MKSTSAALFDPEGTYQQSALVHFIINQFADTVSDQTSSLQAFAFSMLRIPRSSLVAQAITQIPPDRHLRKQFGADPPRRVTSGQTYYRPFDCGWYLLCHCTAEKGGGMTSECAKPHLLEGS